MGAPLRQQASQLRAKQYSIAIVTEKGTSFPEIARYLAPTFKIVLASTQDQIQAAVHDFGVHGIIFNLDCIGEGAADGIEVLQEIRRLREDIVLVALTE